MLFRIHKCLKLMAVLMLMLSCAFFRKPQPVQQDGEIGKPISNEKLPLNDGNYILISGKIVNKNCQS